MLIAFSGVDCSGKSTQIEWLRNYFISRGKSCTVFWYRPGYSKEMQATKNALRAANSLVQWPLDLLIDRAARLAPLRALLDKRKARTSAQEAEQSTKSAAHTAAVSAPVSSIPAPLWLSTAVLDTALQWGIKLRYLQSRYDVVICDRYFEDARLDLLFKYPEHHFADKLLMAMQDYLPKPDHYFTLSLPFETVLERAAAKDEPFPEDEATRKRRFRAYERINFGPKAHIIDANQSIEAVHQEILKSLAAEPLMTSD